VDDILDFINSQWLNLLCIQIIEVFDKRRIVLQYLANIGTFFEVLVYHDCSLYVAKAVVVFGESVVDPQPFRRRSDPVTRRHLDNAGDRGVKLLGIAVHDHNIVGKAGHASSKGLQLI
jgi:hypothetical protein